MVAGQHQKGSINLNTLANDGDGDRGLPEDCPDASGTAVQINRNTQYVTGASRSSSSVPPFISEKPAPGKFVKQVATEYQETGVYHCLYLPTDWKNNQLYPVIVEYAGNQCLPFCTGRVEDCKMGYYQSGGKGFIWVVMPYINQKENGNQLMWWGNILATVRYCKINIKRICEKYGGDTSSIFLTGFSRGAIACGYIGLYDDEISDIWLAFLPHSHHDGGSFTVKGARERLSRISGRASLITYGSNESGKNNSLIGEKILEELKFPVQSIEIPDIPHTDTWIIDDTPARRKMRDWITTVLREKPGTHAIQGKVVDECGNGIAGVRIQMGSMHWTFTNEQGIFQIMGLPSGERALFIAKDGYNFLDNGKNIQHSGSDLNTQNFIGHKIVLEK